MSDFNLWTSFIANNPTNEVLVASSADGVNWSAGASINQASQCAPSLVAFNNRLYVAFTANNSTNDLLIASSADGVNWTGSTSIPSNPGQSGGSTPSLAVFNNRLYVAFLVDNTTTPTNDLFVASSADGVNWSAGASINQTREFAMAGPSLAGFNNRLYIAFLRDDLINDLLIASSADGVNWTGSASISGQLSKFAPSLAVFNNILHVAFIANNPTNEVLIASSADGVNWSAGASINQASQWGPSLAGFNNRLYVAFTANNATNNLLIASSADGVNWSGNSSIHGQLSKFAPALNWAPEMGPGV